MKNKLKKSGLWIMKHLDVIRLFFCYAYYCFVFGNLREWLEPSLGFIGAMLAAVGLYMVLRLGLIKLIEALQRRVLGYVPYQKQEAEETPPSPRMVRIARVVCYVFLVVAILGLLMLAAPSSEGMMAVVLKILPGADAESLNILGSFCAILGLIISSSARLYMH